ncbi:MAG: endonuclease [Bacteroidetes bacterium]|nr:endonuclease [Bacteroidota bacterium]MBU1580057.1 endonuclease [Bacteroidota bacterium]MBU2466410.1 endonuclease [Bacteroidota bacterium]MBU2557593.1 endonuclease [Bacteroidota bacterium]
MRVTISFLIITLFSIGAFAQQTGYYNGVEGKDGEQLKAQLNDIISGHTVYSYFFSKEIFKLSDQDPDNPSNVITVYGGFSRPNDDYGTGGDFLNREHVWAKSHGTFDGIVPMDSDVHNLKPADASVNQSRSNKDFDNGGTQHPEATDCYFTADTWEPRDGAKGDIARIIFYMATRYEGENGELDLEAVDEINTYPTPTHGRLSTLLEWNMQDPPDAFERNRNNVIFSFQQNRNPFIDNPEFANLIWADASASAISIANVDMMPDIAVPNQEVSISASISSENGTISNAKVLWGLSFDNLDNEIMMNANGALFNASIPGQAEDATVYYKITANDGASEYSTVTYNYYIPKVFAGELVSIYDIQGQTDDSPYADQVVSTTGVVTGSFGSFYFLQDGAGLWNGVFVYESGRNPAIGDSIIVTGKVKEYYGKTEIAEISDYYYIASNRPLPEPMIVEIGEIGEAHEGIQVKVLNATCIMQNYQSDHYMWWVSDGLDTLKIKNTNIFEYEPELNASYDVTGPLDYDFDEWKIQLRFETDVTSGTDVVLPQVTEVTPLTNNTIKILFNEDVTQESVENINNFSLNNDITVIAASQHTFDKKQVNLEVSTMTSGTEYTLNIEGVTDLTDNVMEPFETTFTWVGISENDQTLQLSIYPNPAREQLMLSFNATRTTAAEVRLYDISGRVVFAEQFAANSGTNSHQLETARLSAGFYQLVLTTADGNSVHKLIIE